jgi:peptidoglycan/LPS O-acetylase OafA/YrhL
MTIGDFLLVNRFVVNFFRFLLAVGVLISHSYVLGGFGAEPSFWFFGEIYSLGAICVAFFFMLSGFFIHHSAINKKSWPFWKARILRVFPAYVVMLAISAFAITPLIYHFQYGDLTGFWKPYESSSISYFVQNLLLPTKLQGGVKDVFLNTPYGLATGVDAVNGSLWTLPLEVRCYLLVFLFSKVLPPGIRKIIITALTFFLFLFLNSFAIHDIEIDGSVLWSLYLVFFFIFGALISEYDLSRRNFFYTTLVMFFLGVMIPLEARILLVLPLVLSIALGCLAVMPKKTFKYYRWDLSFGVYIWAWPISQIIEVVTHGKLQHFSYLLVITSLTVVLAALSWKIIEQPSLRHK